MFFVHAVSLALSMCPVKTVPSALNYCLAVYWLSSQHEQRTCDISCQLRVSHISYSICMSYTILSNNNIIFHLFSVLQWEEEEEEEEERNEDEVANLKGTIVSLNDALHQAQVYNRKLHTAHLALQRKYNQLQKRDQIFGTAEPLAPLQTSEAGPSCSPGFPDHVAAFSECWQNKCHDPYRDTFDCQSPSNRLFPCLFFQTSYWKTLGNYKRDLILRPSSLTMCSQSYTGSSSSLDG